MKDWKGNKGWGVCVGGGDMENKQTRQQTARKGGGEVTKLALFRFWLLALAAAIRKSLARAMDGRWHEGLNGWHEVEATSLFVTGF